ncbi:MAG: T9SS type A sorting domain-containing protein, partial [candidate division Zixibacteria bacterium]|nr:T9SS type A sorting domain-containing protein [candidate division Zixibacteria bacterium]
EASLVTNLGFSSAKGTPLGYRYVAGQHFLLIGAASGYLNPLDTIGVTLNAGLNDLAGYGLDQTYVETFVTGVAVYPGDANNNGIVDERDILPLGLYWGNTGPIRGSVPDLTWAMAPVHVAFQGERWEPLGGVFADADGSGIVEANDICGITENWTRTHTLVDDDKNSGGASLVTSLDGVNESVLQALYQAVLTCPESQGRNILRESLEAALGQPAAEATLPTTVELYQNYPNPFNPFTTIRFYLPSSGRATLSIYNMLGQSVATLIDGHVNAGYMEATWDATDATDHAVASGIYFYRLETTDFSETRRMMLLK